MTQKNFEHRLLDSLMDEWNPVDAPKRRRSHARAAMMPIIVVGVAGALVMGTQIGSNDSKAPVDVAGSTTSTTLPTDPKLIASAVTSKLQNAKDVIVHAKQTTWKKSDHTGSYEKSEMWSDGGANHFRNIEFQADSDAPAIESSHGSKSQMIIDYQGKTFTSCVGTIGADGTRSGTGNANDGGSTLIGDIKSDVPVGRERIDGVDTLHLLDSEEGMNREIWVDAQSLLPVRMTAHGSWGSYVIEYDWLTRSDDNLRLFQLASPAGFKNISTNVCKGSAGRPSKSADPLSPK